MPQVVAYTFDTALDGWRPGSNAPTVAQSTTAPDTGAGCLQVTATSVTSPAQFVSPGIATTPGVRLTITMRVRPEVNRRSLYLSVNWFASVGGAYLSTSTGADSAFYDLSAFTLGAYSTVTVQVTPPAGANAMELNSDIISPAVGDIMRVDNVVVTTPDAEPVANAGVDFSGAPGATATLIGTPAGGVWSQDSGPAVTLSTPVTTTADTRVTFTHANPSTTTSLERVFRYTVG